MNNRDIKYFENEIERTNFMLGELKIQYALLTINNLIHKKVLMQFCYAFQKLKFQKVSVTIFVIYEICEQIERVLETSYLRCLRKAFFTILYWKPSKQLTQPTQHNNQNKANKIEQQIVKVKKGIEKLEAVYNSFIKKIIK